MRSVKAIATLAALTTLGVTGIAYAGVFTETRTVRQIVVSNPAFFGTNRDWIQLNGLTSHASCGAAAGGVVLKLPARSTDEYKGMLTLLTAAKAGARPVTVEFTNDTLTEGFCTVRWVALAP
jgi:hypothetical protein